MVENAGYGVRNTGCGSMERVGGKCGVRAIFVIILQFLQLALYIYAHLEDNYWP